MPQLSDLEIKIIALLLGPAVIAAIITGTVSIILSRRSARLENITGERSKWREQIREISKGIQTEDREQLAKSLQLLKLHLNAYAIPKEIKDPSSYTFQQIMWNTHIWAIIQDIENDILVRRKNSVVKKKCTVLIDYLSFLLKYDWERAKSEVNRGIARISGYVLMTGSIFVFLGSPRNSGKSRLKYW